MQGPRPGPFKPNRISHSYHLEQSITVFGLLDGILFILIQILLEHFVIISGDPDQKVSKGAKIRNRYNQVPHLTQNTNGKVTNSQLDTTNESQEVSPFPAGDHKAHINRRSQSHSKHKTEKT